MYKDKEKVRQYQKDWVRQKRGSTSKGSTEDVRPDVRPSDTPRMATRPNRLGSNGLPEMVDKEYNSDELLDGSKRYLGPFCDGQVLDRTTLTLDSEKLINFQINYGRY